MCGISGIYSLNNDLENTLNSFNQILSNRGPNNSSFFIHREKNFGMGHTRLSILDLSKRGNQPMFDHTGDWVITFNGEIYNHVEIREYISKKISQKIEWRSESDTETILLSNHILGFEKTLELLEGMFAFALYNKRKSIIYLARDRIGEKPLYYYHNDNKFIFGSDLLIFKELKNINLSINDNAITKYLKKGNIGAPDSVYKHIHKIKPGNYLKITNNFSIKNEFCYWNIADYLPQTDQKSFLYKKSFIEEKKNLQNILENTVIKQTISDVQIGSFLSGGVDSALITSILQKKSLKKIKTFTVGFNDKNFDESVEAKSISNYLGTEHYEFFIKKNDIFDFIGNLNKIYSEPFSDSSQIPTYLISKLMQKEAKVILSGDGGDEFYGGYNRYLYLGLIKYLSKSLPEKIKKKLNFVLKIIPTNILNKYFAFLNFKNFNSKLNKLIYFIDTTNDEELYDKMTNINSNENLFLQKNQPDTNVTEKNFFLEGLKTEQKFMYFDQIDYLPNDILCKVDRATMFNSIESRAPFLDHKLVENSFKIPLEYKIKGNTGKVILREILSDYLPNKFINKNKTGFAIPIDNLLRNELKSWAEDILSIKTQIEEFVDLKKLNILWSRHQKKQINVGETLWSILVLQNWFINN